MEIFNELPQGPQSPVALTIGNFDGVHLGHKKVIDELKKKGAELGLPTCALTFSNHPATVLANASVPKLICTAEHKQRLLENAGIDRLYMIPFTKDLSEQSPEEFVEGLQKVQPFEALILGSDATIGKDRTGTQPRMFDLAKQLGFSLEYVEDELLGGSRISSRRIRDLIEKGDLQEASELLGRPYSIVGKVVPGHGRGAHLGFHTANLRVDGLCLPPLGVYAVMVYHSGLVHTAVANLGMAPTVRECATILLEVHLLDKRLHLYEEVVAVEFHAFLRPERRFDSIEALKAQIALDSTAAKAYLKDKRNIRDD